MPGSGSKAQGLRLSLGSESSRSHPAQLHVDQNPTFFLTGGKSGMRRYDKFPYSILTTRKLEVSRLERRSGFKTVYHHSPALIPEPYARP